MVFQFLVLKQYNTTDENLCYLYFQVNQDEMIVPTLCVGMHPVTLCVTSSSGTQSVPGDIPTQERGNDRASSLATGWKA